ncbi:MAG: class I SAM-dependent methyltransferase [Acidobacteriota bacterium]
MQSLSAAGPASHTASDAATPDTGAYYADKLDELKDLFGATTIELQEGSLTVDGRQYRIEHDVIIISEPAEEEAASSAGEKTIRSFSNEWESYPDILPEHRAEFEAYFDLVDRAALDEARCLDLGCGIGRWSYHVYSHTQRLVLVDASRAIFVARRNLRHAQRAIFIRADLRQLPFREGAFDFLFCLGVLHHLEEDCLDLTRRLAPYARQLLIYLYYSLDNRPWHFRLTFVGVDGLRRGLSRITHEGSRIALARLMTWTLYVPVIALGRVMEIFRLGHLVPLFEGYRSSTNKRLAQDVYDRFFTPIEQRVSRAEILQLADTFESVRISPQVPFWHFLLSGKQ